MSAVGEVLDRKDRPAYVRFERLAVEDKAASLKAGHYVARDIDYALVTPPYSKDVFKQKVPAWLDCLAQDVNMGRMPKEWAENYKEAYRLWKNGQEIPLNGTAIKGWGVISPAQQETLIRLNVLTVEDLAGINDEGIRRVGMGAADLKVKATAWLAQLRDKGPLTQEISAVKKENETLRGSVESLTRQVEELTRMVKVQVAQPTPEPAGISASDILPEPEMVPTRIEPVDLAAEYEKKFGKPPHHRMKPATIAEALKS